MDNITIAAVFIKIARLLEIKGESGFKISAYERAADSIHNLDAELSSMDIGALKSIPGVGQAIAEKIQELNTTGHLQFLERLESEIPPSLLDWLDLPGVGPKTTALIWKNLGITTLTELYEAARNGRLHSLPGIGEKLESHILQALQQRQSY
jgi:DNA polymerase (family 10)